MYFQCRYCGSDLDTGGRCINSLCQEPSIGGGPGPLTPPQPQGCICPPTSEQTCQNPMCPRKDNTHPDLKWTLGDFKATTGGTAKDPT